MTIPAEGVLALITARGGSKGLVGKNLRMLDGSPLVGWAVAAGIQAELVTRTVCSTDDVEIAEAARRCGAEAPFLRPAQLAEDDTPDLPVFIHALDWFSANEGWTPEIVVHLRPTSPLRPPGIVDSSIRLLAGAPHATAVRSVCPSPANPYKMWLLGDDGAEVMQPLLQVPGVEEAYNSPRQQLPPTWWQCGVVDTTLTTTLRGGSMTGDHILPIKVGGEFAVDIDFAVDLKAAELSLQQVACLRPPNCLPWEKIKLLAVDVDGTLTPGTIYYDGVGEELKRFHTHDGRGLAMVRGLGVEVAIITEESSTFTLARAKKLGISEVHVGTVDKVAVLQALCEARSIGFDSVAYVGDDLGDFAALAAVSRAGGIGCVVSDCRPEVKEVARYVCQNRGGHGAVRDVCDAILRARR